MMDEELIVLDKTEFLCDFKIIFEDVQEPGSQISNLDER
jgi:hypothetical protein